MKVISATAIWRSTYQGISASSWKMQMPRRRNRLLANFSVLGGPEHEVCDQNEVCRLGVTSTCYQESVHHLAHFLKSDTCKRRDAILNHHSIWHTKSKNPEVFARWVLRRKAATSEPPQLWKSQMTWVQWTRSRAKHI